MKPLKGKLMGAVSRTDGVLCRICQRHLQSQRKRLLGVFRGRDGCTTPSGASGCVRRAGKTLGTGNFASAGDGPWNNTVCLTEEPKSKAFLPFCAVLLEGFWAWTSKEVFVHGSQEILCGALLYGSRVNVLIRPVLKHGPRSLTCMRVVGWKT